MPLPNFLVIGASKSGTSSLNNLLQQHADIFMSEVKEPHYFCLKGSGMRMAGPGDQRRLARVTAELEAYQGLFRGSEGSAAVGEASTNYLYDPEAARLIRKTLPEVRLICLLRDPVERAYSAYRHVRRDGDEDAPSFLEGLQREGQRRARGFDYLWWYRECGFYSRHLEVYTSLFDPEQVLLLPFSELAGGKVNALMEKVERFLELEPHPKRYVSIRENSAGGMIGQRMTQSLEGSLPSKLWRRLLPLRLRLHLRAIRSRKGGKEDELPDEVRKVLSDDFAEEYAFVRTCDAMSGF